MDSYNSGPYGSGQYYCGGCGLLRPLLGKCPECVRRDHMRSVEKANEEAEWQRKQQRWREQEEREALHEHHNYQRMTLPLPDLNSLPSSSSLPPLDEFSLLPIDDLISLHNRLKKHAEVLEAKTGKRVISKKLIALSDGPGGLFIFSDNSRILVDLPKEEQTNQTEAKPQVTQIKTFRDDAGSVVKERLLKFRSSKNTLKKEKNETN